MTVRKRGVARNLFWAINVFGGIKLQYSCSIAVLASFLPHKKFTWTDFGDIYTPYTPFPSLCPWFVSHCRNLLYSYGDATNEIFLTVCQGRGKIKIKLN